MKKIFAMVVLFSFVLTSCSSKGNKPINTSSEAQTESNNEKTIDISAEVISYKDDILKVSYENDEYSFKLTPEQFIEGNPYGVTSFSEKIINNNFGIKVKASISCDEGMTEIKSCDVVSPNGEFCAKNSLLDAPKDDEYKMKSIGEGFYEISNRKDKYTVDLNSIGDEYFTDYPTDKEVVFSGFLFSDGVSFTADSVSVFLKIDDDGKDFGSINNYDYISYYGTVQDMSGDKVKLLLNDDKTVCNITSTFVVGGEVKVGEKIKGKFSKDAKLYNSGQEVSFDFSVIYTGDKVFDSGNENFDEVAYSTQNENGNITHYYKTDITN